MKIYIVYGGWDYEGEMIIGVFDTQEQANAVRDRVLVGPIKSHRKFYVDYSGISVHELNKVDKGGEEYLR